MRIIDHATVAVEASWDEPVLNADGTPLNDLGYSSVYYTVGKGPLIVGAKIPATSPLGGGHITTSMIVPAPQGVTTQFTFQASATDLSGNESAKTSPVPFVVERVGPTLPGNFTIA